MHLSRSMLTGFISIFVSACNTGLVIGEAPDGGAGGGSPSTPAGGGGSSVSTGSAGGATSTSSGGDATSTSAGGMTSGGGAMSTSAGSGGMPGVGGAGGGFPGQPDAECAGWATDPAFEALALDSAPLGGVYGAWGLSGSDFCVARGVEAASGPNSSL